MMTCETTAGALKAALNTILPAVARRPKIPIFAMARLSGRELSACNLDLQISVTLPAVLADGAACLPVAPLLNLMRRLPGEQDVRLTSDGKTVEIAFGAASYRLAALEANDFPDIAMGDLSESMAVDGDGLKRALGFVLPYVSREVTRYYLNGVFFDTDQAIASDGHRLAAFPLGFAAGILAQSILPTPACRALMKLPPVRSVVASPLKTRFVMDGVTMTAKLIDGKYPEWRRVVPSNGITARFKLGRADMLEALRRMLAILPTAHPAMFMAWRGDLLAVAGVSAYDGAAAQEMLSIDGLDGQDGGIGFNIAYLAAALSVLRGAEVDVAYTDFASPVILKSDGGGMLVQMPRRDDSKLSEVCASMLDGVTGQAAA